MIFRVLWIAGIGAIAIPASAQQNTRCTTTYGVTNCTTTGQPNSGGINWGLAAPPVDVGKAYRDAYNEGLQRNLLIEQQRLIAEQRQAMEQQQIADSPPPIEVKDYDTEQRALGVQAGKLIVAGDCAGALKLALEAGNIELANSVKGYCAK